MSHATRLFVAAPFLVLAACAPASETKDTATAAAASATTPAEDEAAVRAAIDAANKAWTDAFVRADVPALVTLYADDAVSYQAYSPPATGRAGIEAAFKRLFSQVKFSDIKGTTEDLTVAGDKAYELGSYSGMFTPAKGKAMADSGRYVNVWKRQADGSWKIWRDMSVSSLPAPKQ